MSHAALQFPRPPVARRVLWRYAVGIPIVAVLPFIVWPQLLTRITSSDFLPHRFCYLSNPALIWLNVTSDFLIGTAYVAISATLAYLVRRARNDIPFSWMFLAFGLFIVACGGTHFMEVLTVWKPLYWLSGDVKVITALASVSTAVLLPSLVPKTMDLLGAARAAAQHKEELETAHARLLQLEDISTGLAARAAAGMATWEWDLGSDAVRWSGDFESLFGAEAKDIVTARLFLQLIHPEDRNRMKQALEDALAGRAEYDSEFRIVRRDGTTRWIIGRGRVYRKPDGTPEAMIGVNMDVTSRKQSEAALQHADRLVMAGKMAASVAHEINNPLESVTNLVYLIQSSQNADDIRQYAEVAQTELTRVAQIVRQTLGFYREDVAPAEVRISSVLDNVLELYSQKLHAKQISVEKRYSGDDLVLTHAGELRQVFANLVQNAIEAIPNSGCMRLRVTNWSADGLQGVRVTIADNGVGIPRERRGHIFEPFYTTKGNHGTGLGLWVSQTIMHKQGGLIRARSIVGESVHATVFAVLIPKEPKYE